MESRGMCEKKVRKNKCKILVVDICLDDKCPFKQTKEQQEESQRIIFKRLGSLNREHQLYIADKYYGGDMPWQKGGRVI